MNWHDSAFFYGVIVTGDPVYRRVKQLPARTTVAEVIADLKAAYKTGAAGLGFVRNQRGVNCLPERAVDASIKNYEAMKNTGQLA